MLKNKKILILGKNGLVGSSLVRQLEKRNDITLFAPPRADLDLLNQSQVFTYFKSNRPDYVVFAAAKVGGIKANNSFRADFIYENLATTVNCMKAAFDSNVEKFLFLGSSCIYPKYCPQPIKEEYLLTAELEPTNEPYAIAKIAGLKLAENFRRQYGKNFFSVMPTNLYGINDNFHPENSHVIPALINRLKDTIDKKLNSFEIWGTGNPRREFLYVDDLANACIFLLDNNFELPYHMNVGAGEDISIRELAEVVAKEMNFKGRLKFNTDYPDGTPQKLLDISKIKALGWKPEISLEEGIRRTVQFYLQNKNIRKA